MHCFIARLGVEGIIRIANLCFLPMVFLFYSDLKQIRTFVAKRREMSKIRAFWYLSDIKWIRTFVAKRREMLKIRAFWYLWDLKRIRIFVAKRREMSKIRAFWYLFWLKQMRFDSDFTQTSGQKNGEWSLWPSALCLVLNVFRSSYYDTVMYCTVLVMDHKIRMMWSLSFQNEYICFITMRFTNRWIAEALDASEEEDTTKHTKVLINCWAGISRWRKGWKTQTTVLDHYHATTVW